MTPDVKTTPIKRVVITTRKSEESKLASLNFSEADVKALSKTKKDPAWLAKRRLEAWKKFASLPMPTLNDEAWRRTDLRLFKWNDVQLSALDLKFKPKRVPAAYLKPLVGKEQG